VAKPLTKRRPNKRAAPRKSAAFSRSDYVYQQILDAIAQGRMRGEPIREVDLAKKLGVSRTPVRESLQRLEERGLLTASGRSVVVATLGEREALELYAIREVLEGTAARFAAERAAPQEVGILERMHAAYMQATDNVQQMMMLNWRFHRAIHEAAHNRYLLQAINGVHDSLLLLHSTDFRQFVQSGLSDIQHRQIINAIADRDAEAADAAARAHVRSALHSHYAALVDDQQPRWVSGHAPQLE
jgi:DNA-binding GntR family transcriptional regulator